MNTERTALEAHLFRTRYEPIVDLRTGGIVAFDARTHIVTGRDTAPAALFADARARGLGLALECHAVARALRALDDLPETVLIGVPISPEALQSRTLLGVLAAVDARRVMVEMNAETRVSDYADMARAGRHLRSTGARLAVAQVGRHIDQMVHVTRLDPDIIKLAPAVVAEAARQSPLAAHVRGLVAYGIDADLPVIAEGIASDTSRAAVIRLGVRFGQGPLLAPGRPVEDLDHFFRRRPSVAA